MNQTNTLWSPQAGPQTKFCQRKEYELLYGGAAGGGKSDALLMEGLRQIDHPSYRAIYFRRTFPNLQKMIDRSWEIFPAHGGKWNGELKRWQFPSGAIYKFGHMKDEADKYNYQSDEYAYIAFDELTQFTETQYLYLHSRCRSPHAGIRCYIRAASNPGNIGHAWVKRRFIDPIPPYQTYFDDTTGLSRAFIPAKVWDNKILVNNDPLYVKRLEGLPENDRRMLLEGDWNVFAGQAFGEIRDGVHIVKPFVLHPGWFRFVSMDWGYSKPFSIGWWAVDGDKRLIRYRELYGWNGEPDVGCKRSAKDVAAEAWGISVADGCRHMVADPACWHKLGHEGPSIAEAFEQAGFYMEKANNDRLLGKQVLHNRFDEKNDDGIPMIVVFNTCVHWKRTIPELIVDENKPEDVDTRQEDHNYDETRYAIMSSFVSRKPSIGVRNPDRHYRGIDRTESSTWLSA